MTNIEQGATTSSGPRVSVLMTYYNKRAYVEEAIASVLASSFDDLELLVVDDASTDGGIDLVRAIRDPRIRILESPVNTGRAAAANRGFDAALGEFVAILDADDVMLPGRLAEQVAFLDQNPEVGVVGTYVEIMGRNGAIISAYGTTDRECKGAMLLGDPLCYGSAMFRRAGLNENGLRCDPSWTLPGMDHLFLLQVTMCMKVANLTDKLTLYRIGEQNMRHGRDYYADRMALYHRVFQLLEIAVTDDEIRSHLMLQELFKGRAVGADVRALRRWLDHLEELNRQRGLLPVLEFERSMEDRWRYLYHTFADHGLAPGLMHLRCSGRYSFAHLYYLMKVSLFRIFSGPHRKAE